MTRTILTALLLALALSGSACAAHSPPTTEERIHATMTATELLHAYLENVQAPDKAAALFADDGILELPTIQARAQGPAGIEKFIAGLLQKVPTFRFQNVRMWIETPDRVFAEYSVEAVIPATGKVYKQTYAGVLIAEHGKIKLLREALDTRAAADAFRRD